MANLASMMSLPYLKGRRTPRINPEPIEEKLVQGSQTDHINEKCLQELMDACANKDTKLFRQALESLITNMMEF